MSEEPFAPAAVRARIDAALAVINVDTLPDTPENDRARARAERDLDRRCRMWPTALQVAALRCERGIEMCRQRWGWVSERELYALAVEGGVDNDDGGDE